uniref:Condensin-2 complex subunit G2 isoform X1 n=1 Tax=Geotrypetes seraphini TaxID=260995 RepID=A0A6P8PUE6_GEOSA|nr:condensin-2 complex subunit G2 isoform X1 [Geotrypetes seraphini]XP_033787486.1 condensin-2 complex subunit G2 isoform X1 [Geotrypetes seraphini]XP_033787487.1 condensin-2 complex subunit G2 isoform X1 [Geotrypetes seraphini]
MSKREAFLQATVEKSMENFLHFIQLHKGGTDPFDLNELLQELTNKQKEELWERLKNLLTDTLLANPVEKWQRVEDDSDDEMEVEHPADLRQTMAIIDGVTVVATASIPAVDENMSYRALQESAVILNGILRALPKSETALQLAIQHLCEAWWEKGLEGKEELVKIAFILSIRKSLEGKSTGSDINHLWHFHQALLTFDYCSEESTEVKDLLLQCFMSVNHVKKEEGKRFLSFLFSWNPNFIKMIHGTIKNQLQCFPQSLMVNIAEMYFRAWKKASGDILEAIEHTCIQDFMHHGIHLPRNSPVHPKVRKLLSYFHQQKLRQGVEEMLCRLYQPIIWRGLKARNSQVRSNAALLFVEAFPIRDPHLNNEEMDNEIQKQFDELFNLLEDPHPLVRSTGVLGVCKITAKYWEMIPPAILTELVRKILVDLASDVSSADVRCSVFKCLPILLDNRLCHPLLEQLLPSLKYSLHDNSEKVRVAFVDMLLKIKAIKAAKFWKICPMEHLLTRLEVDSRPVARRIVNLLFNSFFPVSQAEEVWCERCVTLIQMNPMAARKFFLYTYEHTAPTNIAKLMLTIRRCLNACIQRTGARNEQETDDEDNEKENSSVLNDVLSTNDSTCMAGLLEIIVILWKSIHKALDQNEEAKIYTISKFATVLPEYLKVFKEDRCIVPLIVLASFMPASAVPTFSCGVLSKLRNLEKSDYEDKYSTLIDCLCRWGQVGHILELITDWLTEGLPQKKNKKNSMRQVRIQDTVEANPELALQYTEYILAYPMNRDCLLSVSQKRLNQLLKALGAVKVELGSFMKASDSRPYNIDKTIALRAFSLYCRLSIHFQHKFCSEGRVYLSVLEETGVWLENQILPFLQTGGSEEEVSEDQSEVSLLIIEAYLTVCKDVLMVGLGDSSFQTLLLDITFAIVDTEKGWFCIPLLLSILKELVEIYLVQNIQSANEETTTYLAAVQKIFQKILENVARRLRKHREEALQLLRCIQSPLGEFVHTVQCWSSVYTDLHHGVLSTLLAAVVVEMSHSLLKTSNLEDLAPPESLSHLPPLSNCLMTIIVKSANVIKSFCNELMDSIVSGDIEGIVSLSACLYIIAVVNKGKHKMSSAKDIASTIYRKLKNHGDVTMEDSGCIERALFELSVKILDDLLLP